MHPIQTAVINNKWNATITWKIGLTLLCPASLGNMKQKWFHKGMKCIIGKGLTQHVHKLCFTLAVYKVDNATSNCFMNSMISTCMMFLLEN